MISLVTGISSSTSLGCCEEAAFLREELSKLRISCLKSQHVSSDAVHDHASRLQMELYRERRWRQALQLELERRPWKGHSVDCDAYANCDGDAASEPPTPEKYSVDRIDRGRSEIVNLYPEPDTVYSSPDPPASSMAQEYEMYVRLRQEQHRQEVLQADVQQELEKSAAIQQANIGQSSADISDEDVGKSNASTSNCGMPTAQIDDTQDDGHQNSSYKRSLARERPPDMLLIFKQFFSKVLVVPVKEAQSLQAILQELGAAPFGSDPCDWPGIPGISCETVIAYEVFVDWGVC